MQFILKRVEDAARILEYYHSFHDAFFKKIVISSRDEFLLEDRSNLQEPGPVSQLMTGKFDVEIWLAHYNYSKWTGTLDHCVRATFRGVRDIRIDLSASDEYEADVCIINLKIGSISANPMLYLEVCRDILLPDGKWRQRSDRLFCFEEAEFQETILGSGGA